MKAIALGGDTVNEINFKGVNSTGGGSVLYFLVNGTTSVFEALKKNKQRFSK